jgi:membrane protease subunit HflC
MKKSVQAFGVFLIVMVIVASQALFIVPETHQVIVLRFGDPVKIYPEPGLKVKAPLVDQIKTYDSRVLDVDPPAEEVILADQKRLVVDTFARYKISDMLLFYQKLNTENQATTRLHNLINSRVRANLGNVSLLDILSEKRSDIMNDIRDQVNESAEDFGVEIVDVRIGRADLPEQTSQSIYARMRSEREQEAAEFRAQGQELAQQIVAKADREKAVILAEAKKKAEIIRGLGDELAIKIYADAYNQDPDFYSFYRSMNAYEKALDSKNSTLVLSPDSEFFKFFGKKNAK